jgi:hypothetical protein
MTGHPTYTDATARPPGPSVTSNPGAPSIAQLLPLLGTPSLRPGTSLCPLTFADWNLEWKDGNDKAGETEESNDDDLEVSGTAETKQDDVPAVEDTKAAALAVNAHGDDDATSLGSGSPPLLTIPHSPKPLAIEAPPPLHHIILDSGAAVNYAAQAPWMPTPSIRDLPVTVEDHMATLHWAISDHLTELDRQRISIDKKYDALHDLLIQAQTNFKVSAIKRQVCSAVGAHSAQLVELVSNATVAINVKYNDISAMHTASKLSLSEALTIVDASNLTRRSLAAVDDAIKAAVAPGGQLEQHISKEVTSAVINTVNQVMAWEIHPPVHDTLDKVFTSYRDCILMEQHLAETDLATSFQAQRELAKTDFQEFLRDSTSATIDTLDAALCSTKQKIDCKQNSVVEAITTACWTSNPPTPAPLTPLLTSLGTLEENATPVGASKVAWADLQNLRQPTPPTEVPAPTSPPLASTHPSALSGSPAADAT